MSGSAPPVKGSAPKPGAAATRDRLVAAALDLLTGGGPGALNVRRIAELADCSTIGVYSHFGGKGGLLDALYRLGFRRLDAALDTVAETADPVADLLALLHAYRRMAHTDPALYGLMFERSVPGFVPPEASRREAARSFDRLVAAVRRCAGHGLAAELDAEAAAFLLWGSVHGLVSIELMHRAWNGAVMDYLAAVGDADEAFDRAIRSAVGGLRAAFS